MPKIPEAIDFGPRPSQRSNRGVDSVDRSELIIGESIQNAANEFSSILKERRQKTDRVNYSIAKADLLAADLDARESLKDDEDWDTFDPRYRESMSQAISASAGKIRSKDDRAIFEAEARLMMERGAAQVSELRRQTEGDEKIASLNRTLAESRERILTADPGTRNAVILNQLDIISGAEEQGLITDVQAEKKRREYTQDVARSSLVMMPAKDRAKAIKASLANRKEHPLTPDDIKEGKGTGSVADFLHAETAKKMLKQAEAESEIEGAREAAYEVSDAAASNHPEDFGAQMKYVRKNLKGKQRTEAEALVRARERDEVYAKGKEQEELLLNITGVIDEGQKPSDIPASIMAKLDPSQKNAVNSYYKNKLMNDEGFALIPDADAMDRWRTMSDTEKTNATLNSVEWKGVLDKQTWASYLGEQDRITSSIENGRPAPVFKGQNLDDTLDQYLFGQGGFGFDQVKPKNGDPEYARYRQIQLSLDQALRTAASQSETGDLTEDEQLKVLNSVLTKRVFLREDAFGPNILRRNSSFRSDEPVLLSSLSPAQYKEALLPIEDAKTELALDTSGNPLLDGTGKRLTVYDQIINIAKANRVDVGGLSDFDIEEAYFYLENIGEEAAINRLIQVEGY